jgi:hypothetical protein
MPDNSNTLTPTSLLPLCLCQGLKEEKTSDIPVCVVDEVVADCGLRLAVGGGELLALALPRTLREVPFSQDGTPMLQKIVELLLPPMGVRGESTGDAGG